MQDDDLEERERERERRTATRRRVPRYSHIFLKHHRNAIAIRGHLCDLQSGILPRRSEIKSQRRFESAVNEVNVQSARKNERNFLEKPTILPRDAKSKLIALSRFPDNI